MKFKTATAIALILSSVGAAAQAQKKVIQSASDIPPVVIDLPKKPSELVVEGGAGFDAVKDKVETHAETVLRDYDVKDATTAKQMRSVLLQVALAENRWDDALRLIEEIRALEEKPAAKATSGVLTGAYAPAAKAVGEDSPQFRDRFKVEFEKSVAGLDWTVAQDSLQAMRGQFQLLSRDLLVGSLQGSLDANAAAQGNKVAFGMGAGIVGARTTLTEVLPLKEIIFEVLNKRVLAEATEKEDRWSKRLAAVQPSQVKRPVTIAIWDSGLNPQVLAGNLWKNPREVANGKDDDRNGFVDDVHGIAFDTSWARSTGALRPMPAQDLESMGDTLKLVKGSLDLQAAVDSEEAGALRQKMGGLKPADVMPFQLQLGRWAFIFTARPLASPRPRATRPPD